MRNPLFVIYCPLIVKQSSRLIITGLLVFEVVQFLGRSSCFRRVVLLEFNAKHQSREILRTSCSLGWIVESLYPFGRFIEEGSRTNCVSVWSVVPCFKTIFWSSIWATVFTRSACSRSRISEVPRHWVIMWTRLSLLAEQMRHLGSVPLSLASLSPVRMSPIKTWHVFLTLGYLLSLLFQRWLGGVFLRDFGVTFSKLS